jgi:hypothetical protein
MLIRRFLATCLIIGGVAVAPAGAITVSGTIPNLDPPFDSFTVTTDVTWSFDDQCLSNCTLHFTLTNSTVGQLQTIGQTLSGITFEPDSAITIDRTQSTVMVDATLPDPGDILVGSGSAVATGELLSGTMIDITRHWGFDLLIEPVMETGGSGMLGSYVVSSVGDVVNGGPNEGLIGTGDLFTSGILSSVEPSPPNGTPFSIVNNATCSAGTCGTLGEGFQDSHNRTWVQDTVWISLNYDGQLTSLSKVEPIFGTDGLPNFVVPGPGVTSLFLLGALGLFGYGRRRF